MIAYPLNILPCFHIIQIAVRVNGDTIRQQLFKDYAEWSRPEAKTKIDAILEAQVRRALEAGQSVIRDHRHGSRAKRDESRQIAAEYGARPVIVWVQTPAEIAIKRTIARPQAADSIIFDARKLLVHITQKGSWLPALACREYNPNKRPEPPGQLGWILIKGVV